VKLYFQGILLLLLIFCKTAVASDLSCLLKESSLKSSRKTPNKVIAATIGGSIVLHGAAGGVLALSQSENKDHNLPTQGKKTHVQFEKKVHRRDQVSPLEKSTTINKSVVLGALNQFLKEQYKNGKSEIDLSETLILYETLNRNYSEEEASKKAQMYLFLHESDLKKQKKLKEKGLSAEDFINQWAQMQNLEYTKGYKKGAFEIINFYENGKGNCEASTKKIIGDLLKTGFTPPKGFQLGVQFLPKHVQPVLFNPKTHEVRNLVTDERVTTVLGPIYRPEVIAWEKLNQEGINTHGIKLEDLLLIRSDDEVPGGLMQIAEDMVSPYLGGGQTTQTKGRMKVLDSRFSSKAYRPKESEIPEEGQIQFGGVSRSKENRGFLSSISKKTKSTSLLQGGLLSQCKSEVALFFNYRVTSWFGSYCPEGVRKDYDYLFRDQKDLEKFNSFSSKEEQRKFISQLYMDLFEKISRSPDFSKRLAASDLSSENFNFEQSIFNQKEFLSLEKELIEFYEILRLTIADIELPMHYRILMSLADRNVEFMNKHPFLAMERLGDSSVRFIEFNFLFLNKDHSIDSFLSTISDPHVVTTSQQESSLLRYDDYLSYEITLTEQKELKTSHFGKGSQGKPVHPSFRSKKGVGAKGNDPHGKRKNKSKSKKTETKKHFIPARFYNEFLMSTVRVGGYQRYYFSDFAQISPILIDISKIFSVNEYNYGDKYEQRSMRKLEGSIIDSEKVRSFYSQYSILKMGKESYLLPYEVVKKIGIYDEKKDAFNKDPDYKPKILSPKELEAELQERKNKYKSSKGLKQGDRKEKIKKKPRPQKIE
tara:strand:- start:2006 stop:4465 length:2460 start_codon:yes stop_codon:yes gene_type:complete